MPKKILRIAKLFFSSDAVIPFLIGAIILSVLGNSVTTVLFNLIGSNTTPAAITIILGTLLIFVFFVWTIAQLSVKQFPAQDLGKSSPELHQGLILLVSRDEPCRAAISYHLPNLKFCWLICSNQTLGTAQQLQKEFPQIKVFDPWVIHDIYDPVEFNEVVRKIYEKLPEQKLQVDDVIADFTGMTAQGSVGMVLASRFFPQAKFQYTPAELSDDSRPTGRSLKPIGITIK
jgi:hypothetical protein